MSRRRSGVSSPDGRTDALDPPAQANTAEALLSGFPPVIAPDTRILLLGSFPGVASLNHGQYYAHPRNQFWRLVGACLGIDDLPALPYAQRLDSLLAHRVGIWDVVAQCRRRGSLDAAVKDAQINPLADALRARAPALVRVGFNGGLAWQRGRHLAEAGYAVWRLPSSSPAAAQYRFEDKLARWRPLFDGGSAL